MLKTIVHKPTTVMILFFLIFAFSIYTIKELKIDLLPDFEIPVAVLVASYTGAGPQEVENRVTRPLENVLTSVSGVQKLSSTSSDGQSVIILEFNYGVNLNEAINDIREKLDLVVDILPDDVKRPGIFRYDPSQIPIIRYALSSTIRNADELYLLGKKQIISRLEQIEGVASVYLSGGREKIVRLEVNQNRLEAYNLTMSEIAQALNGQNFSLGGGDIIEGNITYSFRAEGRFHTLDEIRYAVIGYRRKETGEIVPISLRDVGTVSFSYKDKMSQVLINGEEAITISLQKESGANTVQVANNIQKRIEELKLTLPRDISFITIENNATYIKNSIQTVGSNSISGGILAMLIIFLFLRSIKSMFIVGISIPISILITFMSLIAFDYSLNVMTLAGLTLGIGMVVDGSIVVLEHIYTYRIRGAKLVPAALFATKEMSMSIIASTLTTVCVFAPVLIFKNKLGINGEFFAGLSFVLIAALLSSLLVALTIVPVLASTYLPLFTRTQKPIRIRFFQIIDNAMDRFFCMFENGYGRMIRFILYKAKRSIALIVFLNIVLIVSCFTYLYVGAIFIPSTASDSVGISVTLPIGSTLARTETVLEQLRVFAEREIKGYQFITTTAGSSGMIGGAQKNVGEITIKLLPVAQQIDKEADVKEKFRTQFDKFPFVEMKFVQTNEGSGDNQKPIDVILSVSDFAKGKEIANQIISILNSIEYVVEPSMSLSNTLPELVFTIDRARAYDLGLNIYAIAQEVSANLDGIMIGTFDDYAVNNTDYDILLYLNREDRSSRPDLEKLFTKNSSGVRVALSNVGSLNKGTGPTEIQRENQKRVIHITANMSKSYLTRITTELKKRITNEIVQDGSFTISYGGDSDEFEKIGIEMFYLFILSIILVFGVMASQFESFSEPFLIFLSIPYLLLGINIVYFFTNTPYSIFTMMAILILGGLVVNNGIVLIDYIRLLRKRGYTIYDACSTACKSRFRPILMTSLTTILGMAPLSFATGEGVDLVGGIARAVFGGMLSSTLITLLFIPALYRLFYYKKYRDEINSDITSP